MMNKDGFYRHWSSQELVDGSWLLLDNRGKIAKTSKNKFIGIPMSEDRNADRFRGISMYNDSFPSTKLIYHEHRPGFEVGTTEERIRARIYTKKDEMDFIGDSVRSKKRGLFRTTCLFKNPKYIPGDQISISEEDNPGIQLNILFFNHIKSILDKTEFKDCFFSYIRGCVWIYDSQEHKGFQTLYP